MAAQEANPFGTNCALHLFRERASAKAPNGARFESPGRSGALGCRPENPLKPQRGAIPFRGWPCFPTFTLWEPFRLRVLRGHNSQGSPLRGQPWAGEFNSFRVVPDPGRLRLWSYFFTWLPLVPAEDRAKLSAANFFSLAILVAAERARRAADHRQASWLNSNRTPR